MGLSTTITLQKRSKVDNIDEGIATNKGGRPTPGYPFDKDGYKICDEQIKAYILEVMETEGLYYNYYKIALLLRRKFNLTINKKKVYRLCRELDV